jgi:hypothetical protein
MTWYCWACGRHIDSDEHYDSAEHLAIVRAWIAAWRLRDTGV